LQALNRISSLMRPALESSTSSSESLDGDEATGVTQGAESPAKDKNLKTIEAVMSRSPHICTAFAQMTTLIELVNENKGKNVRLHNIVISCMIGAQEFLDRTRETVSLLSNSTSLRELILSSYSSTKSDEASSEALQRSGDKVDRALEKLRKTALKSLESVDVGNYSLQDTRTALVQLLEGIVGLLENVSQVASLFSLFFILDER
jgi:sulfite reductase alpha subunit-like flavoprotein